MSGPIIFPPAWGSPGLWLHIINHQSLNYFQALITWNSASFLSGFPASCCNISFSDTMIDQFQWFSKYIDFFWSFMWLLMLSISFAVDIIGASRFLDCWSRTKRPGTLPTNMNLDKVMMISWSTWFLFNVLLIFFNFPPERNLKSELLTSRSEWTNTGYSALPDHYCSWWDCDDLIFDFQRTLPSILQFVIQVSFAVSR